MSAAFSLRGWTSAQRRAASVVVLLAALALLAAGVASALLDAPGGLTLGLLLGLVLLLGFQVALLVTDLRVRQEEQRAAELAQEEAPVLEEVLLTLRCGECGTTFDVTDAGTRPLRTSCPGCGAESVIGPAR